MTKTIIHTDIKKYFDKEYPGQDINYCDNLDNIDYENSRLIYVDDCNMLHVKYDRSIKKSAQIFISNLKKIISKIENNQTIAVLIKSRWLMDASENIADYCKYLMANKYIKGIVQLNNSHAQKEIKDNKNLSCKYQWTSLLVLKKGCTELKLSDFYSFWVTTPDNIAELSFIYSDNKGNELFEKCRGVDVNKVLIDNKYRLLPSYLMAKFYVDMRSFKLIRDYATVKQGCHSTYLSKAKKVKNGDIENSFEILNVKDVSDFVISSNLTKYCGDSYEYGKHFLKEGDIVLSVKNSDFKYAMFIENESNRKIVPSSNFVVIRTKEGISPAFIFRIIDNIGFWEYIDDVSNYTYYSSLRMSDILDAPVFIPNDDYAVDGENNKYMLERIRDVYQARKELDKAIHWFSYSLDSEAFGRAFSFDNKFLGDLQTQEINHE